MAKKATETKPRLSREEVREYIALREKKRIILQKELTGKRMIYSEDIINDDGSVDFKLYYINKEENIRDSETIIYTDLYSERKKRETAIKEHRRKHQKAAM